MSRVKDPIEKKRLSLARDHRVFALEGNKTFRKAWRLKKAKAAQEFRRAVAKDLQRSSQSAVQAENVVRKPRRSLKKFGVMSLSQSVAFKGGQFGSRWNLAILGKNKDALAATRRAVTKAARGKPKR
jgi:hypothetical protein